MIIAALFLLTLGVVLGGLGVLLLAASWDYPEPSESERSKAEINEIRRETLARLRTASTQAERREIEVIRRQLRP